MFRTRLKERRENGDKGAALVEFAICLPIFIALLMLIFDAGVGFSDSRDSASAARSAALVGARAGETRFADFRVLDSLRAQHGDGSNVSRIWIYRTDASNPDGNPPASCTVKCNEYAGSVLATLNQADFTTANTVVNGDIVQTCSSSAPDAQWCPLGRRADEGAYLAVQVESRANATVGLGADGFDLVDRAVFALYFPPLPTPVATP